MRPFALAALGVCAIAACDTSSDHPIQVLGGADQDVTFAVVVDGQDAFGYTYLTDEWYEGSVGEVGGDGRYPMLLYSQEGGRLTATLLIAHDISDIQGVAVQRLSSGLERSVWLQSDFAPNGLYVAEGTAGGVDFVAGVVASPYFDHGWARFADGHKVEVSVNTDDPTNTFIDVPGAGHVEAHLAESMPDLP